MPRFIAIGYGDQDGYDHTAKALREAAHAHDQTLRDDGALMGIAGSPVQVRNHQAQGLQTQEGPYLNSALPVAGFMVFEAETLADAINAVSKTPCAIANGVVEVWPLE